jgi:hypothetical protein
MVRRRRRSTVTAVDQIAQPPSPRLVAPDGRAFERVDELTPAGAMDLVRAGARVAWDSCGCLGGFCDLVWFDPADGPRLYAAGPPILHTKKGTDGELTYWRSPDGPILVLATYDVRWGRFMY